jgi:hypothetical protein
LLWRPSKLLLLPIISHRHCCHDCQLWGGIWKCSGYCKSCCHGLSCTTIQFLAFWQQSVWADARALQLPIGCCRRWANCCCLFCSALDAVWKVVVLICWLRFLLRCLGSLGAAASLLAGTATAAARRGCWQGLGG